MIEHITLTAYTDGASSGNPGPSGAGYIIEKDGVLLEEYSEYIGETTNNIAEYSAFIAAIERMKELRAAEVVIYSDSELMVKQINGAYRVKNAGLKPLFSKAMQILSEFNSYKVIHILREKNSAADSLASRAVKKQKYGG